MNIIMKIVMMMIMIAMMTVTSSLFEQSTFNLFFGGRVISLQNISMLSTTSDFQDNTMSASASRFD